MFTQVRQAASKLLVEVLFSSTATPRDPELCSLLLIISIRRCWHVGVGPCIHTTSLHICYETNSRYMPDASHIIATVYFIVQRIALLTFAALLSGKPLPSTTAGSTWNSAAPFSRRTCKNQSNVRTNSRACLLYTSPSPRDKRQSRMPSSA